jgi:hypothetical protein
LKFFVWSGELEKLKISPKFGRQIKIKKGSIVKAVFEHPTRQNFANRYFMVIYFMTF